jgi:hypothetical protein
MFLSLGIGIFIGLGLAAQQDKKIQIVPPRTLQIPIGSEVHFFQNDQYGTEIIVDTPTSVPLDRDDDD